MDFLPRKSFRRCVQRYGGNSHIRSFTCYEQFLCMAFAQLTYRDSLRDTVLCLRALQNKLHHVGIQSKVSRSTLADANENRDWRIYSDFAQILIGHGRKLYSMKILGWNGMKPYMSWIHLPSIYAAHFSLGRASGPPKAV